MARAHSTGSHLKLLTKTLPILWLTILEKVCQGDTAQVAILEHAMGAVENVDHVLQAPILEEGTYQGDLVQASILKDTKGGVKDVGHL